MKNRYCNVWCAIHNFMYKNLLFSSDDKVIHILFNVHVHSTFLKNCNTKNGKCNLAMCLDFFRLILQSHWIYHINKTRDLNICTLDFTLSFGQFYPILIDMFLLKPHISKDLNSSIFSYQGFSWCIISICIFFNSTQDGLVLYLRQFHKYLYYVSAMHRTCLLHFIYCI